MPFLFLARSILLYSLQPKRSPGSRLARFVIVFDTQDGKRREIAVKARSEERREGLLVASDAEGPAREF